MKSIYPIRFFPIYKDYIWGGNRIKYEFNRRIESNKIAESWEIVDREEDVSIIANGRWKNYSLHELLGILKDDLTGKHFNRFPLIIKIIDAKESLSVQVHPNKEAAKILSSEEKIESWVTLEDSFVYAGVSSNITNKDLKEAVKKNKLENFLMSYTLNKGDIMVVFPGMVHSICKGSLLLEIQQNSNTTYRLYDWNRLGIDNKPRALHINEALISFRNKEAKIISSIDNMTVNVEDCFHIEKITLFKEVYSYKMDHKSFHYYFCLNGKGTIKVNGNMEILMKGYSYLIPAIANDIEIATTTILELVKVKS